MGKILFGTPPKDIGVVGEMVLDWITQGFWDHIYEGGITKQDFGQKVHKQLKKKCESFGSFNGVTLSCEPFFNDKGQTATNSKGTVGVDVLIKYKGTPVVALELKTGKGMSKNGFKKRQKWIGTDVVEITIHSARDAK